MLARNTLFGLVSLLSLVSLGGCDKAPLPPDTPAIVGIVASAEGDLSVEDLETLLLGKWQVERSDDTRITMSLEMSSDKRYKQKPIDGALAVPLQALSAELSGTWEVRDNQRVIFRQEASSSDKSVQALKEASDGKDRTELGTTWVIKRMEGKVLTVQTIYPNGERSSSYFVLTKYGPE